MWRTECFVLASNTLMFAAKFAANVRFQKSADKTPLETLLWKPTIKGIDETLRYIRLTHLPVSQDPEMASSHKTF